MLFTCCLAALIFRQFPLISPLCPWQTLDGDPIPTINNNLWQSRPILEWSSQQVCLWLVSMDMDQYAAEFTARGVDGTQLLGLDGEKLKVGATLTVHKIKFRPF